MTTTTPELPLHAVVLPIPLQGHVIPAVHLAIRLASRGFTITFVNTQIIHHQITKSLPSQNDAVDIFAGAREAGLDIRYKTVSDGFPLSFDRMLNHDQYLAEGHLRVLPVHVDELVRDLVDSADPPVTCLIADTFFGWQSSIAEKYDLVYVSFWTEAALVFSFYYHLDLLRKNGHYGASHDNRVDTIDYIPGVKAIEPNDIVSYLRETDVSTAFHRVINQASQDVKRVDFILCNTVHELEPEPISAIQENQPMYAIGPLFPSGFTNTLVPTSLKPESGCTQWLNTKPRGSVLYVSFGSFITCGKNEIDEIAHGLLLSNVNFIWVLRSDAVSYEESYVLPTGFQDEVKDRGLIVTWTNQIEVISHPALGGFLTHCGWNSVLESLWYGVPILCFPLETDQLTNRKLLVDDWRIAVNLCDRKPLTRFEVAEKINRLMSGKLVNDELRKETLMKVRQMVENALAQDGSSEKNLCQFISDVKAKISERVS